MSTGHTYLRYECADSFGLAVSTGTSQAPTSSQGMLAWLNDSTLLTTAGSYCQGWSVSQQTRVLQLGHRDETSIGTGRALNGNQVVCVDVVTGLEDSVRVATGWIDGAVRIFDLEPAEAARPKGLGMPHSLLLETNPDDDDFAQREPLVLRGHGESPVRTVVFDRHSLNNNNAAVVRLASGGSQGAVVVWDVLAETGLFRLVGHRGAITALVFVQSSSLSDCLVSTSLDGHVKVWDLQAQACVQTLTGSSRGGAVETAALWSCSSNNNTKDNDDHRRRLVTGGRDGRVRVWNVSATTNENDDNKDDDTNPPSNDSLCHAMGMLGLPANMETASNDKVVAVHHHHGGGHRHYLGVLHDNSKHVHLYLHRNVLESQKKRRRRLKRRQEKATAKKSAQQNKREGNQKKRSLLDDEDEDDEDMEKKEQDGDNHPPDEDQLDPTILKAMDEFEFLTSVHASHKVKGFSFDPKQRTREILRVVCALATNALEIYKVVRRSGTDGPGKAVEAEKLVALDMYGHPTGLRGISLSTNDELACTVSKNSTKIWKVQSRAVVQSLSPSVPSKKASVYGLCVTFLPGNTHVVVGSREGHLLLIDIASGEVVSVEENAHDGAIWSMDVRKNSLTTVDATITLVTGAADNFVKFWELEEDENGQPCLLHTRTLQMTDDVVAVRYSNTLELTKRLVFVCTLDSTIKVFFDDSLKLFLSLYGHKLPALAVDASDDDQLLVTGGADKTIKIWGLDFGDTHRTLHGHDDSIQDLKFVRRTHNFFSCSKDGTVRYWDADRFEQILVLRGHAAETNCLAVSRTGAFVLSGGMDRQVRVWERTRDIVFLEEERERELEQVFDRVKTNEGTTAEILGRKKNQDDEEDDNDEEEDPDRPQSEAAVQKSIMSIAAGDRLLEAIEKADQELKEMASFRKANPGKKKQPNMLLLGLTPSQYVLWVLKSIRHADLEQSLLVLPIGHIERLLFYLISLLKAGRGVELCSRVGIFLVKTHQNQITANKSLVVPLAELLKWMQLRLGQSRDMVGLNIAALRMVGRTAHAMKQNRLGFGADTNAAQDIWSGLGLGSDLAAALQGRPNKAQ